VNAEEWLLSKGGLRRGKKFGTRGPAVGRKKKTKGNRVDKIQQRKSIRGKTNGSAEYR